MDIGEINVPNFHLQPDIDNIYYLLTSVFPKAHDMWVMNLNITSIKISSTFMVKASSITFASDLYYDLYLHDLALATNSLY